MKKEKSKAAKESDGPEIKPKKSASSLSSAKSASGGGGCDFERLFTVKANGIHPVTKYRSKSTGLEVVHAEIGGPLVYGDVVVATRADDNDGLPHALEHLIFRGSEDYPYSGLLDRLANKCMADDGTEGTTYVDHTTFSVSTASSDGFCRILPVFMDHIFHPVFSETEFQREVYHVTGEGKEAGKIYSEMYELENTGTEKMIRELHRLLYPPESGYHYDVGGLLENLRESCTLAKVKKFHKKYYTPRNTCLIVCGMVESAQLFKALEPVIKKLKKKGVIHGVTKPWQEIVLEVMESPQTKTVQFAPAPDQSSASNNRVLQSTLVLLTQIFIQCYLCKKGKVEPLLEKKETTLVTIGFRGPSAVYEYEEFVAMTLLLEFLLDDVDDDYPLVDSMKHESLEYSRTAFYLYIQGCDRKDSEKAAAQLRQVLEGQLDDFDKHRMANVIERTVRSELNSTENSPHITIYDAVVADFLYNTEVEGIELFEKRISKAFTIQALLDKPKKFWLGLIQRRILDKNWATIFAIPSSKYQSDLAQKEQHRLGQLRKQSVLSVAEMADQANDSEQLLKRYLDIKIPNTDSIHFHKITSYQNPKWASHFQATLLVDDIHSNFVYVNVIIDTSALSTEHKQYLKYFREDMISCDVMLDDGSILPSDDVEAEMKRELVSYELEFGIDPEDDSYYHLLSLRLQMEIQQVEFGMQWIRKLLWQSIWYKADQPSKKEDNNSKEKRKRSRDGLGKKAVAIDVDRDDDTVSTELNALTYRPDSLKLVVASCPGKEKQVSEAVAAIQALVTDPKNVTVHVATNLEKVNAKLARTSIKNFANLLQKVLPFDINRTVSRPVPSEPDAKWMISPQELRANPRGVVISLGNIDASCLSQAIPGPSSYVDPDLPALRTTIEYFTQSEGPIWKVFHDFDSPYDGDKLEISVEVHEGLIYLNLDRCSDLVEAYKRGRNIIESHLNSNLPWSADLLASAKGSAIYQYVETESTPWEKSKNSLLAYYQNLSGNWVQELVKGISKVQLSDLEQMTGKYLIPLFCDNYACAVVCPRGKSSEIIAGFKRLGKILKKGSANAKSQ